MNHQHNIEKTFMYKVLRFSDTEPETLTLTPDHFNDILISKLYAVVLQVNRSGQKINVISIHAHLLKEFAGKHDEIRDLLMCASACENEVTTMQTSYLATYLREYFIKKNILNQISQIQIQCIDSQFDITDVLNSLSKLENEAYNEMGKNGNLRHLKEFVCESVRQSKERLANFEKGVQNGIPSGIKELDEITCNFQASELIIIGGRPAMGKTAIALIIAKNIAKMGKGVALFELEMSGIRLADRLILSETEINSEKFKKGNLSAYDFQQIDKAQQFLSTLPFFVDDKASQSIHEIRSKAAVMVKKGLLNIIIIDYLGLMETDQAKGKTREREVAEITRQTKIMAKDFNIPVILLCQLSRPERGHVGAPQLTSLRDSGSIEQDADMVIFPHRPEYYSKENATNEEINLVELHVAKLRDGQTSTAKCYKNDNFTKLIEPIDKNLQAFDMPINKSFDTQPF